MKIDKRSKWASRKFWTAVIGFITTLLVTFNVPDMTIEKIAGLITAMGGLIAFILAEGWADAKRAEIEYLDVIDDDFHIEEGNK